MPDHPKVETVRDWLKKARRLIIDRDAITCESPLLNADVQAALATVWLIAEADHLLDARIIRGADVCPECNGTNRVPDPDGGHLCENEWHFREQPVWIVTGEAWSAAVEVLWLDHTEAGREIAKEWVPDAELLVARIASALLGGPVEVAREIGTAFDSTDIACEPRGDSRIEVTRGDRIAILEEKHDD